MNGFQAYSIYNALRLHYTNESYNAYTYNFKSRVSRDSFERRKDKYFFERLGRKHNEDSIKDFYNANMVNGKTWIGDMHEKYHVERQARIDSLSYRFKNDINKISEYDFNELCLCKDGNNPLIDLFTKEEINIETVAVIDKLVNFIQPLLPKLNDPLGMKRESAAKVMKYKYSLTDIPIIKLKNILIKEFTNHS